MHACVPPLPWSVGPEHVAEHRREDLRELRVCSVDPPGCRDIDDALSVTRLPPGELSGSGGGGSGDLEIGVHIADVTNFLHPGTAMDDEAAR